LSHRDAFIQNWPRTPESGPVTPESAPVMNATALEMVAEVNHAADPELNDGGINVAYNAETVLAARRHRSESAGMRLKPLYTSLLQGKS
jgi:hypothetical protein